MIYKYYSHAKLMIMIVSGLIAGMQQIVLAYMVQTMTNIGTQRKFGNLPQFIVFVFSGFLITFLASLIFNRLKTLAIKETNIALRSGILKGMLKKSTEENATSLGYLTTDFKLLETNRFDAEIEIMMQFFMIVYALGYALVVNWVVTLLFLVGSCFPMIVSSLFQKKIQKSSENWTKANGKYVSHIKNLLAGSSILSLYGKQNNAVKKNLVFTEKLESELQKMNLLNLDTGSWITLIVSLFTFTLPFLVGIYMVVNGQTTLGALFAIVQLSNSFVNPIMIILEDRNKLSTTKKIMLKAQDYINEGQKSEKTGENSFTELEVKDLNLTRENQTLAKNISFQIKKGEKVAIIGPSGTGKSTLFQYLMTGKFGQAKEIILNNEQVIAGSFKNLFAYASQSPIIFSDTLWFNLTLGENIPQEIVIEICTKLGLDSIISEKGWNYSLGDNADQLSGGQLARIGLARTILMNRPILLLDEINSSLDRETSNQIHDYLLNSDLSFIEIIHHYESQSLSKYTKVINLEEYI